jgi:beta-glucuronidase
MRIVSHAQKIFHSTLFSVAALTTLLATNQHSAFAQTKLDDKAVFQTLLVNVDHRKQISLNGDWHTIVDPYGSGLYTFHNELRKDGYFLNEHKDNTEYDFSKSPTLKVPGDWNTQRELLHFYEGPLWYQRDFTYQKKPNQRTFVHIGAANYRSFVWVNGKFACQHEGGFTPYDCDATDLLHDGNNFIVIAVDATRLAEGVPTLQTDWFNYGGLTRDVALVEVPTRFIDDYDLHLERGTTNQIDGYVHVIGSHAGDKISVSIATPKPTTVDATVDADGRAPIQLRPEGLELWSPEHPKLYKVQLKAGVDTLDDEIGFRTIEVHGTQILLNGKPIFLHGVSIHAEAPVRTGRAHNQEDADTLLGWVKELGGNYARLAHYPHDQRMTRTADRLGILIWSEIPVYWACHFDDPATLAKAQSQLHEMIRRDRNKASVILWSVANETPNNPERTKFLTTLANDAREYDPTRLITAALLVRTNDMTKIVDDPLGKALDVIGANEYVGWYEHKPSDIAQTKWQIDYQKPLIISEFGAGAKAGLHGTADQRWTEEFQANVFAQQMIMLNNIPQLRGMSPWVLMDFRSPRRVLPEIQDGFNRKGLLSEKGERKQAFSVLQKAYKTNGVGKAE